MTTKTPAVSAAAVAEQLAQDGGIYGQYELAKIRISPDNRKRFNEQALQELAASITSVGVAQPILIRPVDPTPDAPEEYEIVAGERRYRASKIAGKETIPALCRNLSNLEAAKLRILENLQREDPHPMEEAEGYQLLMLQHGFSADQLADEVKKSKAYVYARLKLCALAPEAREPFLNNEISASTALLIARIPVPKLQVQALKEVTATDTYRPEPMSYRSAADHVQRKYMLDLKKAVFPLKDAKLLASAGSCVKCPKRAGNQPEIFEGVAADVCTDPECFAEKKAAHYATIIVEANKRGIPVLDGEENDAAMSSAWGHSKGDLVRGEAALMYFARNAPGTRNGGSIEKWLGEDRPAVIAYGKDGDGTPVPLYSRAEVQKALEVAGACETVEAHAERMKAQGADGSAQAAPADAWPFPSTSNGSQPSNPDAEKAKQETQFRLELYKRLRKHGLANGFSVQALRELTKLAVMEMPLPDDLLGETYQFDTSSDESVIAYVEQASVADVQLLLIDLLVGELLSIDQWHIKRGEANTDSFRFVAAMARFEGVDPDQVREELFPTPIDANRFSSAADLSKFIKSAPQRINELKDLVIAQRPDLLGALQDAASSLGYVYGQGGFHMPEANAEDPQPAAQQLEHADATDEDQADSPAAVEVALEPTPAPAAVKAKRVTKKATKTTSQEPA
jgi:ParB/RepB/Spo0J family partition protein